MDAQKEMLDAMDAQKEMLEAQKEMLEAQKEMLMAVKRIAVATETAAKASHFMERRQDSTCGLLQDWRRHQSQFKEALNDKDISEEEKKELVAQNILHKKDRIISLLKGSCFSPFLLLLR